MHFIPTVILPYIPAPALYTLPKNAEKREKGRHAERMTAFKKRIENMGFQERG